MGSGMDDGDGVSSMVRYSCQMKLDQPRLNAKTKPPAVDSIGSEKLRISCSTQGYSHSGRYFPPYFTVNTGLETAHLAYSISGQHRTYRYTDDLMLFYIYIPLQQPSVPCCSTFTRTHRHTNLVFPSFYSISASRGSSRRRCPFIT